MTLAHVREIPLVIRDANHPPHYGGNPAKRIPDSR
jgi:hypothetical protein